MDKKINASPTKQFFIAMLTKDIKLERAIIDLIDNSIDGAKNLTDNGDFSGLFVKITINSSSFTIEDNCGGFSLKTAQDYAFMFGRPEDGGNDVKHSVGRFGVGMKRALFKIGKQFEVESKHQTDHYQVSVNVDDWSRMTDWTFDYTDITPETSNLNNQDGTYIKVENLNPDVSQEFESEIFLTSLKNEIERTLSFSIDKNLQIFLNDSQLSKSGLSMLENTALKPFYKEFNIGSVEIKVFAGIGAPNPELAGWYIYCNDRLVLEKDKTNLTGWEGKRFGESGVQKYHNIYAMFRGIVFFSSDDSKALPMTTTKTGIDSNSPIYKAARFQMINAMTQVMTFLKGLESDEQRSDLVTASEEIDVIQLSRNTCEDRFKGPELQRISESEDQFATVSFRADKREIDRARSFFRVSTNKDVGLRVFEYFLNKESENL